MSSRKKPGAQVSKRPYVKPQVKQVSLKPEEAVLGGCKVTQVNSPNTGMGYFCSFPTPCSAIVS